MNGIRFRHPLSEDLKLYGISQQLKHLLESFDITKSADDLSVADLMDIQRDD
jgi:hypothetical protein